MNEFEKLARSIIDNSPREWQQYLEDIYKSSLLSAKHMIETIVKAGELADSSKLIEQPSSEVPSEDN